MSCSLYIPTRAMVPTLANDRAEGRRVTEHEGPQPIPEEGGNPFHNSCYSDTYSLMATHAQLYESQNLESHSRKEERKVMVGKSKSGRPGNYQIRIPACMPHNKAFQMKMGSEMFLFQPAPTPQTRHPRTPHPDKNIRNAPNPPVHS